MAFLLDAAADNATLKLGRELTDLDLISLALPTGLASEGCLWSDGQTSFRLLDFESKRLQTFSVCKKRSPGKYLRS